MHPCPRRSTEVMVEVQNYLAYAEKLAPGPDEIDEELIGLSLWVLLTHRLVDRVSRVGKGGLGANMDLYRLPGWR